MEAAYDILLLAARVIAVALVLFVAWSVGIGGVRLVTRQRRSVDAMRARLALAEREVRNGLRGATTGMRSLGTQLSTLSTLSDTDR